VLVEVRPTARLRGKQPVDLPNALAPILRVLGEDSVDLARTRVVCDWIQYRNNFREVVDVRPVGTTGTEIAVDLRRCANADDAIDLTAATRDALAGPVRTYLEGWVPGSGSLVWRFNSLYWQALSLWEEVTGKQYEQALPGGQSDARDLDGVRELISWLFEVWDSLAARNALPDMLYVVELGVGNGNQAKAWLDEFRRMDAAHGRDYYRRLHYLMGDYSPHVLELAKANVAEHAEHVSGLVLDAVDPTATLGFLRHKASLVYISNVYDNLPTDEVARIGGRAYRIEVRGHLADAEARRIAAEFSCPVDSLPSLIDKLLRLGPELLSDAAPDLFGEPAAAVAFWRECWAALRLEERYVPLEGLESYPVTSKVTGELLRPLLEARGDIRMHVSNGAVTSFANTLPLLHPYGRLHVHDLFVTDTQRYETAFSGPGKYDGSVVNWVNGSLLRLVGARMGVEVSFEKFAHNITTLIARVRD
jgi:hypothetical protein